MVAAGASLLLALAMWTIGRPPPVGLIYSLWVLGPPLALSVLLGRSGSLVLCLQVAVLAGVVMLGIARLQGQGWPTALQKKALKAEKPITVRPGSLLEPKDLDAAKAEVEAAVAFAEAGTWEPVEDLLRHVVAAPATWARALSCGCGRPAAPWAGRSRAGPRCRGRGTSGW